jgi:O-antigen/teichoic acid export membrane protein
MERSFGERATTGFAWNYFYKITEFGLINCYTILVVRHFGPEISAPYAVFTALCTTLAMVAAFAVDGVLLRYIQRISHNDPSAGFEISGFTGLRDFLKTLFAFRMLIVFVVALLIVAGIYLFPLVFPSVSIETIGPLQRFIPYLIIFLFAQSITAFCTFSLIGLLENKRTFLASFISRGLLVAGGFVLLLQGTLSLHGAIILYVGSAVINALVLMYALRKEVDNHAPSDGKGSLSFSGFLKKIWEMVSRPKQMKLFLATPIMLYGITTWGSDMLSAVLGRQPDIIMMRAMLGESPQISYYLSASIVILVTEYIFLFGFGGTLVSIFSKLAHEDEQEHHRSQYPRLARAREEIAGFQNVVLIPLCAYMMVFTPQVIHSVYGSKYDEAIPMIRIGLVALSLAVGMFGGGMQITSLVAIGKERLVFRNRLFWGITNVTANIFLIRAFGGLGAVIGTHFSNAFACGSESYFARKHIGNFAVNSISTIRILLIAGVSTLASYALMGWIGSDESPIIATAISLLVSASLTALLYYVFKVQEAKKVLMRIQMLFRQTNVVTLGND